MKLALDKRVILYFDILGYKQKFEEENFSSIEYLQTIRSVMSKVQEYAKTVGSIVLKIFSDNACMVFNTGDKGMGLSLAKIIAYELQQVLLEKYSVLIRGCISYGEIYIDDNLVYGAGLIKCVEMEEKAEFPRIIIDPCLNDEIFSDACNGVQREHNKKLNNGLPILHKVPPKRDYGRYFCIMAEKGGTSHGGLTEKLSPFFHAKKQEVNAYGR